MTLEQILVIMENRLLNLEETRKQAFVSGFIDQVSNIDIDISTTKNTILYLKQAINNLV